MIDSTYLAERIEPGHGFLISHCRSCPAGHNSHGSMWCQVASSNMTFQESELIRNLESSEPPRTAVLMSGGLDSAILAGDLARKGFRVHPIYVRFGLRWEQVELSHARRFVETLDHPLVDPITVLDLPTGDSYGEHWSRSGPVPDENSPDEAVYLPGRNVLLVSKAAVWCALHGIRTIHTGVLSGNPFPDATDEFFAAMSHAISIGLAWKIEVVRPYANLKKIDVIRIGRNMPLDQTFSCLSPIREGPCGRCNKCEERRKAFREAGIEDHTAYAY